MWIKGLDSVLHSQIPEVNRYFRIFIMLASRGTFYNWHWFLLQAYLKVRKNFSKTALTFFFLLGVGAEELFITSQHSSACWIWIQLHIYYALLYFVLLQRNVFLFNNLIVYFCRHNFKFIALCMSGYQWYP